MIYQLITFIGVLILIGIWVGIEKLIEWEEIKEIERNKKEN